MHRINPRSLLLSLGLGAALASGALAGTSVKDVHVYKVEVDESGKHKLLESYTESARWRGTEAVSEVSYPAAIVEHAPLGGATIVELRSPDQKLLEALAKDRRIDQSQVAKAAKLTDEEVVTLVDSGPSANRIDLVFMGDGYTMDEKEKFFADMRRLVADMFEGQTFASYLPLFNVHAVFKPSNESGIGRNNRAKDTAYRLYREGNTLRAIFPGNANAARASCRLAPGCDYPVIIANDPHYGGLGGEFAISTSSETSGTIVLRHELGHNFGRVGEEYDGGGYFGANHSSSLSRLTWRHWLTNPESTEAETSAARFLDWPWQNLQSGPFTANFRSDGSYASASLRFSVSGLPTEDSLELMLDGSALPFSATGTDDRTFYDMTLPAFSAGNHSLSFRETLADGNNWVSSLTIHEYGDGYHFDDEHIGAYPVFTQNGAVAGYRSNHEKCLMRNMSSPDFCAICQENNWLKFFAQIDVIDNLTATQDGETVTVTLATQKVGPFRDGEVKADEELLITWEKNGVEVSELAGMTQFSLPQGEASGEWRARVEFRTSEVRSDPSNYLKDTQTINL